VGALKEISDCYVTAIVDHLGGDTGPRDVANALHRKGSLAARIGIGDHFRATHPLAQFIRAWWLARTVAIAILLSRMRRDIAGACDPENLDKNTLTRKDTNVSIIHPWSGDSAHVPSGSRRTL